MTTTIKSIAMERMIKARVGLIFDHPFFGSLALQLKLVESHCVPTAGVTPSTLYFNPDFIAKCSDPELRGLFAHEVMHVASGHCWRRDGREPGAWNVACDKAINYIITNSNLVLPNGALSSDIVASAEEHFANDLSKKQQQDADDQDADDQDADDQDTDDQDTDDQDTNDQDIAAGQDNSEIDPGGCGAVLDADSEDEGCTEEDWQEHVILAAKSSRMFGNLPYGIDAMVKAISSPEIPWEQVLADFVQASAANDYDYSMPDPEFFNNDIVLPDIRSNELGDVVIVNDTSGSITNKQLEYFCGACGDVLAAYPMTLHVLAADSDVRKVTQYTQQDLPIEPPMNGRGFTDFRPAFQWVADQAITPSCLIYLTDLEGSFPESDPGYPVLWVTVREHPVPFGQVLFANIPRC